MDQSENVTRHYSTGGLLDRLLDGLRAAGKDIDALTPEDLHAGDQFHTGGAAATAALLAQMDLGPGKQVLDIGCGVGGVSRAIAHSTGAMVSGVDLTPDFIETARGLSARVGLDPLTSFQVGSATDLPFHDRFFDAAVMVHVGMNIPDKAAVFKEAARVIRPGGQFAIFEIMSGPAPGDIAFPQPWASAASESHLASPATYARHAESAGFDLQRQHNMRAALLERLDTHPDPPEMPPFDRHIVMGPTFRDKVSNYYDAVRTGRMAPVEMFFTRPI